MRDFGLLLLRLALGGLLAGHGAQKLFGAFGGHGIKGTGGFFESALGLKPGEQWALLAGGGEFGGGMLTVVGLLHPIGPLTTMAPMIVAWAKVHAGKPIWASEGGAELPLLNMAIAAALICTGPGKWSVDHLLGVRPHPALTTLAALGMAIGSYIAISQPSQLAQTARQSNEPAGAA
ncbi:MAG TPA: DoxX family protein [Chloroflexota bacterium]|jgi:putative oxidoreductase|nr:DoxX family protein [Chloroflexota bacterium]